MRVIGTAGHVDHGKSTLVEALTGTHPDRLKEEREREMTIDLGFAWLTLPDGEEVGIVDVPGHRDFIENMLAGVGGIDAALFVVAADEGVMPQTREHLAILDLLQIQGGVVALTKIDLMDDPEWLDLIEEDLRRALSRTVLEAAPVVRVSARSREGLPLLRQALSECLAGRPPRPDYGRPRLPVDRIFTIAGFGTVATGTLTDGSLHVGEDVEVLPAGLKGRVRGLQTHKRKEEAAVPGGRTAVNIGGVAVEQIRRGDVLARPGSYRPSRRLDVRFRLLPDVSQSVKHNIEVKLFVGAAEVLARLRLIGAEELRPGDEGWLQLELAQEVVVVRGDRYILRRPSPGETLGGGVVLDAQPKGRHKRFSAEVLARLEALAQGTPAEVLFQALLALGAAQWKDVAARSSLDQETAVQAGEELLESGQMLFLEEGPASVGAQPSLATDLLVTSKGYWELLSAKVQAELENYHRAYPLKRGMPKEELKSRLKIPPRLFNAVLRKLVADEGIIKDAGPLLLRPGHEIRFSAPQQRRVDGLLARFAASPYTPPSVKEAQAEAGEEVYNALLELGALVQVAPEVVFRREDYERMVGEVRRLLQERGTLTAAGVRDHFNTSRKYALALLEHLDSIGVTVRDGDARRLKK
jgi:selenocysteine-specific elongation factor